MRLYLDFVFPNYGKFEITEPEGFDAFSFNVVQPENRFGRDKSIGAKEIDLNFWDGYRFDRIKDESEWQVSLNGTVQKHLSMQLERILEAIKVRGSETEIYFIVADDNGENGFVNGLFDIQESTTDGLTYFSCSVVQDTNKALIERKKDIKANVFSTVDTFGNPQTPVSTTKILLKAQPFYQVSTWKYGFTEPKIVTAFTDTTFNYSSATLKFNVENSLSFIPGKSAPETFKYVEAQNELTNVKVKLSNIDVVKYEDSESKLKIVYGETVGTGTEVVLQSKNTAGAFNSSFEYDIPIIIKGHGIWIYFDTEADFDDPSVHRYTSMDVEISATATAFDSVINGVDYFKFLEKGINSISGLPLEANEIKTGEFSGQYVFNGNLIRQIPNKPLNFVFKDEMSDLAEINADYQILEDKVEIMTYPNFYPNIEIGSFLISPDEDFERVFNDRLKKIELNYKYETYEQDKDEKNTVSAFNTEAQFLLPNRQSDNKIDVSIKHVRDSNAIEAARKEAQKETTALVNDDKIFLIDCVNLPPGANNSFSAYLEMRVLEEGTEITSLQILSTNIDSEINSFNWTLLGFKVGDTITITGAKNPGTYTVFTMDSTVIELLPLTTPPNFTGRATITFSYPLTDVFLVNRTIQGFDLIENLDGMERYSNLKYSIGRNLNRTAWSSYLATVCMDRFDGVILNTFFKSNGDLTTEFMGGKVIKENAPILVSDLAEKILNKYVVKTQLKIGFLQAKQLIEDSAIIKGFVRVYDPNGKVIKGHIKELDSLWRDGTMDLVLECRNESENIDITTVSTGFVTILETGYPDEINTDFDWFKITGDMVQLFDKNIKPLINLTDFRKIKINGLLYTDKILFADALANL